MNARILQWVQASAMGAAPFIIGSNVRGGSEQWKETTVVWSCVVVALLFIGVSLCAVANAVSDRNRPGRQF